MTFKDYINPSTSSAAKKAAESNLRFCKSAVNVDWVRNQLKKADILLVNKENNRNNGITLIKRNKAYGLDGKTKNKLGMYLVVICTRKGYGTKFLDYIHGPLAKKYKIDVIQLGALPYVVSYYRNKHNYLLGHNGITEPSKTATAFKKHILGKKQSPNDMDNLKDNEDLRKFLQIARNEKLFLTSLDKTKCGRGVVSCVNYGCLKDCAIDGVLMTKCLHLKPAEKKFMQKNMWVNNYNKFKKKMYATSKFKKMSVEQRKQKLSFLWKQVKKFSCANKIKLIKQIL